MGSSFTFSPIVSSYGLVKEGPYSLALAFRANALRRELGRQSNFLAAARTMHRLDTTLGQAAAHPRRPD